MCDLKIRHVLAPVDLGHSSEAALRLTRKIVSRLGARLTLIYVNDALTLAGGDERQPSVRPLPPEQEAMMTDAARQWATPLLGDVPFDVVIRADDPPLAIAAEASSGNADLVVIGTHARSGWDRVIAGSMSESILHATDRPVITVPQNAEIGGLANVLCAIDLDESGRQAAGAACSLARALGARLHVVHVTPRPLEDVTARLRDWIDPAVAPQCDFREMVVVEGTQVAERLAEAAAATAADLVVVGVKQKRLTGTRATLGTTAERILRVCPIPVMSVVRPAAPGVEARGERRVGHAPR